MVTEQNIALIWPTNDLSQAASSAVSPLDGFNYLLAEQTRFALLNACHLIDAASIHASPEELHAVITSVIDVLMLGVS